MAIRATPMGQSLPDPAATSEVLQRLASLTAREDEQAVEEISDREREVLALWRKASPTARSPKTWR